MHSTVAGSWQLPDESTVYTNGSPHSIIAAIEVPPASNANYRMISGQMNVLNELCGLPVSEILSALRTRHVANDNPTSWVGRVTGSAPADLQR